MVSAHRLAHGLHADIDGIDPLHSANPENFYMDQRVASTRLQHPMNAKEGGLMDSIAKPWQRMLRLAIMLLISWCVMTLTHELGHVVGGLIGGGQLQSLQLVPWRMPYSIFAPDPHPLLTLWAGPLLGVLVPMLLALVFRHHLIWFVADFCCLSNGAYLAIAWITGDRLLDTTRLLDSGSSPWTLFAFCAAAIGIGYPRFRRDCAIVLRPE